MSTLNHDYRASDNTTCAKYTYLQDNQYDWNFWTLQRTPQTDSLWAVYPYGDRSGGLGPLRPRGGTTGGGVAPLAQAAGAIDPASLKAWLNGTQIINNGQPVQSGFVRLNSNDALSANFSISVQFLANPRQ